MDTSRPEPELHEPVWRFCASHADIRNGLEALRKLPALAEAQQEARVTAQAVLSLFEQQFVGHHVDEETELFVAVQRSARGTPDAPRVEAMVAQLVREHRAIEQSWSRLRPAVLAVAAGKQPAQPGWEQELAGLLQAYFAHAHAEDEQFLPLADEILSRNPDHLAALDLSLYMRHVPRPRLAYC